MLFVFKVKDHRQKRSQRCYMMNRNNKPEVNFSMLLGVEPFRITYGIAPVVRGSYGLCRLCRVLLWRYHHFYRNIFFKADMAKQ